MKIKLPNRIIKNVYEYDTWKNELYIHNVMYTDNEIRIIKELIKKWETNPNTIELKHYDYTPYFIKYISDYTTHVGITIIMAEIRDKKENVYEAYHFGWDCPFYIDDDSILDAIEIINPFEVEQKNIYENN